MSNRGKDPVTPGKIITVDGIKLTENANSYWYDDYGTKFDWRGARLYKEVRPGVWLVKPIKAEFDFPIIKGANGKDIFGEKY